MSQKQYERISRDYPAMFDAALKRLEKMRDKEQRDRFFVGMCDETLSPITVPRRLYGRHCHILGDPGSNKTSIGLMQQMVQAIRRRDSTVVPIDLKGDMALLGTAIIEAEAAGLPFYFFTLRPGWPSDIFNPLEQTYIQRIRLADRALLYNEALGLAYADVYGASFFSAMHEIFVVKVLETYGPQIRSFENLYRFAGDPAAYKGVGSTQEWNDNRHLHAVLRRLSGLLPANANEVDHPDHIQAVRRSIQIDELLTKPAVVYFMLPYGDSPMSARCVAKLFTLGMVTAAAQLLSDPRRVPVWLLIDEFHCLLSSTIGVVLTQARGWNIGMSISHQSLDQLRLGADLDLSQVVLTACAVKRVFRASDLAIIKYIRETSGEVLRQDASWDQFAGIAADGSLTGLSPERAPRDWFTGDVAVRVIQTRQSRMTVGDINRASAQPWCSLLRISENFAGMEHNGEWIPVVAGYHLAQWEYEQRMSEGESLLRQTMARRPHIIVPFNSAPSVAPRVMNPKNANNLVGRIQARFQSRQGP